MCYPIPHFPLFPFGVICLCLRKSAASRGVVYSSTLKNEVLSSIVRSGFRACIGNLRPQIISMGEKSTNCRHSDAIKKTLATPFGVLSTDKMRGIATAQHRVKKNPPTFGERISVRADEMYIYCKTEKNLKDTTVCGKN